MTGLVWIAVTVVITVAVALPLVLRAVRHIPDEYELWPCGADESLEAALDRHACEASLRESSRRAHPSWVEPEPAS